MKKEPHKHLIENEKDELDIEDQAVDKEFEEFIFYIDSLIANIKKSISNWWMPISIIGLIIAYFIVDYIVGK